jgi:prepilin-type N-terminal cleavage/methylation domain-containing protein
MIVRLTRGTRKRRRQQGGFTLIELLVVITILGILAAIVSVSLLGITSTARKNALAAERQTIQTAFDAMLHDQHVDPGQLAGVPPDPTRGTAKFCDPVKTDPATMRYWDDMTNFPPGGALYSEPNPATGGAGGTVTVLATHYLREAKTASAKYACDTDGNIFQQPK